MVNNKKYRVIFNGYITDDNMGHCKLDIGNGKIIGGIINIEEFETCCYIDFIATPNSEIKFIIKTFNENCKVFIRELNIYSF